MWIVEFEGGYTITFPAIEGEGRNRAIMRARELQSEAHRYDFAGRRASGARVLKAYQR